MAEKVLACCGIEGIPGFNTFILRYDEKEYKKAFMNVWPGTIPAAAVQINLTDRQNPIRDFVRGIGFQEIPLGRNPNTMHDIFAYFMPAKALAILIKEWKEELKPPKKKNNPFPTPGPASGDFA